MSALALPSYSLPVLPSSSSSSSSSSNAAAMSTGEAIATALSFVTSHQSSIFVPEDQRAPRLALKNTRLRSMLELEPLEDLPGRLAAAKNAVVVLQRARTEAFVRKAAGGGSASSSSSSSSSTSSGVAALLDNIDLIDSRLEQAEKEVKKLEKDLKASSRASAALLLKQNRDWLRTHRLAGKEWKRLHPNASAAAGAGAGGGADGGAKEEDQEEEQEEAEEAPVVAVASKKNSRKNLRGAAAISAGISTTGTLPPSASANQPPVVQAHLQLCAYCAAAIDKLKALVCSECSREYCGSGGRSAESAFAGPCIQVYRCGCSTGAVNICHDCFTGQGHAKTLISGWSVCVTCERQALCPKEVEAKGSNCKDCDNGPYCKACKPKHRCE